MHDAADIQRIYLWLGTSIMGVKPPIKQLMDPEVAGTVWKENNKAADEYNKPGKFTAFCAYEWTSNPDYRNMHRNIFFKAMRPCAGHAVSARWIHPILKTSGSGWTHSERRATNFWQFRTTRI